MKFELKKKSGSWLLTSGFTVPVFFFMLYSCTATQIRDGVTINTIPAEIRQDLTVSGDIRVRGEVKVFSGATLTVKPGSRFLFEPFDPDEDGVNDSRLVIEGVLTARGDPDAPIYFSSAAEEPQPGDWLELRIDHSEGNVLEYCVLEHSRYGLHAHFSSGLILNSVFRNNIDGTRFGSSSFEFSFNLVRDNEGKGINLRASRLVISDNRIENNGHGIFMFEKAADSIIAFNLFNNNERSDIRFGDFYQGKPPVFMGNRKETEAPFVIAGYESEIDPTRSIPEFPWEDWKPGPVIVGVNVHEIWKNDIGSFIDAAPVFLGPDHQKMAVVTWRDGLIILDAGTGDEEQRVSLPDITDATPVVVDGVLYFPSWDRTVRAVDTTSGQVIGSAVWGLSMADDHRQASPVADWTGIYMGLWNGDFRKLDPPTMDWLWSVTLDAPVRGSAALAGDHMWVGTDAGSLYEISFEGDVRRRLELDSPVRAAPVLMDDSDMIVVTSSGILYRLQDGKVMWRRKLPGSGTDAVPAAIRHHYEQIWVGDGSGAVSSFTGSGALLWRLETGSAVHVLKGPDYGLMVAGTENDGVALFTGTGRSLGNLESEGAVHGITLLPREKDTIIAYGSRDGYVRGYSLTLSKSPWEPPGP